MLAKNTSIPKESGRKNEGTRKTRDANKKTETGEITENSDTRGTRAVRYRLSFDLSLT